MAAYFHSTVDAFLRTTPSEVLSKLTLSYSADGFSEMRTDTPVAWWDDMESLRFAMHQLILARPEAATWQLLLEFSIPRKMKRLDVVLVTADAIVILECKTGLITSEARRQVEDYALLLHYFHKPSDQKHLYPFVVSDLAEESSEIERQRELELPSLPSYWIAPTQVSRWSNLHTALIDTLPLSAALVDGDAWNDGAYRPTPAIIEAALALRSGLRIGAIAQSEAAEQDITDVTDAIHQIVEEARAKHQHSIVFLTGVPGSGKTLVGLSLAHLGENREDAIHFMSGNGPLVSVLQEVFRRHAMSKKIPSAQAQIEAETLIENVHHFAKEYTERDKNRAPSNHVVIFDEAQRAWDLAQSKRKFAREDSEPDMLLKIMERHGDWACVVALVGGGQEINDGEAGLEEWGRALLDRKVEWHVYASPEVLEGGTSTAYRRLFPADIEPRNLQTNSMLHLRTSNRSLRADRLAGWVNAVLEGDANSAAAFRIADKFPLFLTRNLDQARSKLRHESLGESRYGLIGSSEADRLRAEGLEPSGSFHREYPWHHWYLAGREDVRSSYACEVFATEFEIQGLELDWTGICWGGDLIHRDSGWVGRKFWTAGTPKWIVIKSEIEKRFRLNAYRVLLTRARQGAVIYVPIGDARDMTRRPEEFDQTAEFLYRCGARRLRA
jgi:hypothetical protein